MVLLCLVFTVEESLSSEEMFTCKTCSLRVSSVTAYVQHSRLHSNAPKARFPCCYHGCLKACSTHAALRQHICRDHGSKKSAETNARFRAVGLALRCGTQSCSTVCTDTASLISHLHRHIKDGMPVTCPIKSCQKRYSVKSSFSGHLSRDHTQWTEADLEGYSVDSSESTNLLLPTTSNIPNDVESTNNDIDGEQLEDHVMPDFCPSPVTLKDLFIRNLELFFVKLVTQHLIPESVVDMIAQELQSVNTVNQQYLQQSLMQCLHDSGVQSDCVASVMSVLRDSDLIKICLDEGGVLQTTHKRSAFLQRNFRYVSPESVYLGVDSRSKIRYGYYVPIKKSLEALLADDTVLLQCLASQFSDSNVMSDFTDGSVYKECEKGGDQLKKCLSLILYQDSFEVANPLGSAKRKYKLLGFYFTLGNLESHNRSAIDHIQLVLLATEVDLVRVGQRVFRRLVDDLKSLETDGIAIKGHVFRVIIPAIAGDNLGSHWLGGFVMNFSCVPYMCRFCTMPKSEFDSGCFSVAASKVRTVQSYNNALCELAKGDVNMYEGVKFDSIFNSLSTFHVCNPGLPPCVAHDLFEGVVSYDLPLLLRSLIRDAVKNSGQKNFFSVGALNKRLERFELLGSDSAVRPPQLKSSLDKLVGSASQNWCFLRIVPLLIADVVDIESEAYKTLLLLRSVVELVMSPRISVGQIAEMKILIEDYLERRKSQFPEVRLRPKHHFMTHYAQLTLQFGPLIKLWTLRFESKHQYFKRCIRSSHNFLNVASMLANRHQLHQAYLSASPRFPCDTDVSHSDIVLESCIANDVKKTLIASGVRPNQVFSAATVKGTVYRRGQVLPLKVKYEKKMIVFGEILLVVVQHSTNKLIVAHRNSVFDFDIGCYILDEKSDIAVISLECFADFYPLSVYEVDGRSVAILRHQSADCD